MSSEALRVMRCAAPAAFGKKGTNGNTNASDRRRTRQQKQHKRVNRAFASAIAEDNAATAKEVPAKGTKYEKENEIALDAVRIASTICDKVQAQLMRMDEKSITKGDKSLVTLADYAAQAVIAWRIGQDEPDMKFLGEEDADALVNGGEDGKTVLGKITVLVNEAIRAFYPDAKELSDDDVIALIDKGKGEGGPVGRHWILDPVDGTLGFVRGDQYAIALALMDEGELVLGAMGCPNMPKSGDVLEFNDAYSYGFSPRTVSKMLAGGSSAKTDWYKGCVFTAVRGNGCWMWPTSPDVKVNPTKVHVSSAFDPKKARFCEPVMKANSSQGFTASVADNLGIESKPLRIYSQVKYGSVARADADVFMKFPKAEYREKVWDHAGGVIIVEEAGGVVSDAGGAPLDFSKGRYLELDRGIVAASSALHEKLMQAIQLSWDSAAL
jgi:3'(2'), 5'-bisphosphate nucleotidase